MTLPKTFTPKSKVISTMQSADMTESNLITTLTILLRNCHQTAVEHGWWEGVDSEGNATNNGDRNFSEQIALMHSELSEALEEYRNHGIDPESMIYYASSEHAEHDVAKVQPDLPEKKLRKPEGIAVELADLVVRLADTCCKYHIPLGQALVLKMRYNQQRPYRHGGKKC